MKKILIAAALAGALSASAITIVENFATDPAASGWQMFGNTNLFQWNPTNQNLEVTWDSTQPNSYFYQPLGTTITRNDDFSIAFDLTLRDSASGVEPGKTGPLQLEFGFLNFATASSTNFQRGVYGSAQNIAAFDYYPSGYYDYFGTIYDSPAATVPSFISGADTYSYAPQLVSAFNNELPTNQTVRVSLAYTASNQTAVVTVTTNGVSLLSLPALALAGGNGFSSTNVDFLVDTFSISSYSSAGNDYDSVRAHGAVANLIVTVPPPAQNLALTVTNGNWQVVFSARTNWLYTLERTTDLQSWTNASPTIPGLTGNLTLADTNPPTPHASYRVRAVRP